MSHIKTYKFRLLPTKSQEEKLSSWLGATRYVYNLSLQYKKTLYQDAEISISKNDLQKELTQLKKDYSWMNDVHSQVLQDVTDRLFKSYDNFFRRVKKGETPGFPKFAKKDFWSSFSYKQGVSLCINTNKVKLPKVGLVKHRKSQQVLGNIKTASVKKEGMSWFVCISSEVEDRFLPKTDKVVGVDLGIKDLAITSDGEVFSNPKTLRVNEDKLKEIQRRLSRKKKGSKNRNKMKGELKRAHLKIKNTRRDNLHKISSKLVSENQVIICEKLNTKGMLKNHKLAKSISDASWGQLTEMIKYKSAWAGRTFLQVNPAYTSQDCNCCGWRNSDLKLSDRSWTCDDCGVEHDRDVNAGINILNKGMKKLKESGHDFSTLKYETEQSSAMEISSCISKGAEEPLEVAEYSARIQESNAIYSLEDVKQYRQFFYPTKDEVKDKKQFKSAWENHKKENAHHWQNWTVNHANNPYADIFLVENIVDWVAMGFEFDDTALAYYENNKEEINLPEWAIKDMYKIFDCIYPLK